MWFDRNSFYERVLTPAPRYKPDHPGLRDFIEWLETKDPHETYDWLCPSTCACGQFSAERFGAWYKIFGVDSNLAVLINDIGRGDNVKPVHWTWGQCLKRAQIELAAREAFEHV